MMQYFVDVSLERLRESYEPEFRGMSAPEREAGLFCKMLEKHPLYMYEDDLLAGWYGFVSMEEMEQLYCVPAAAKPAAEKVPAMWLAEHGYEAQGYDRAHFQIDHKTVLSCGLNYYLEKVCRELENPENTPEKNDYLRGMRKALSGSEILTRRYAALAQQQAEAAQDPARKARFARIAQACRKVPMNPPSDFFEAAQSVLLLRVLSCIAANTCVSVSLGNFDQYMYPYYFLSKQNGMGDEEVVELLLQLFRMLDHYEGLDCTLSVGGVDENGNDATNDLSWLIVKAEKKSKLRAPLFAARVNRNTPKAFLRELVCKELFEMGQPSFYSEENCRTAVAGRGIPMEEAKKYQVSSCMQIVIPSGEATHGWGARVNTHLPLELALNGGKPLVGELPIRFKTQPCTDYQNLDEIFAQYRAYMQEMFPIAMDWNREETQREALIQPNPWLSALQDDCISRGKDRWGGGARYHNLIIEMMGFANTADAFTAIDQLVFEQKKYTIDDFIKGAQANYQGYEVLHRDILGCAKYGMNDARADRNARRLLDINAEVCESQNAENRRYLPSLHTLHLDVYWGMGRPAFLDGRLAGEPVNHNAGPSTAVRRSGPTNLVLSACKLDQIRYSGGQALDVHIGIRNMDSAVNRDKIGSFIQAYFDLGGLQMQVNGLSADTLKKAYEKPEAYPNLIIRLGGHSRYFNELDNEVKLSFIERFEVEEGADK